MYQNGLAGQMQNTGRSSKENSRGNKFVRGRNQNSNYSRFIIKYYRRI